MGVLCRDGMRYVYYQFGEERVKIMSIFMQPNRIPLLSSSQTVFHLVMKLRDYSLCIQRKIYCFNYINISCH